MTTPITIGTRGSDLALWQANTVKALLAEKGYESELKIIQSTGDKDRKAKLHEMGLVGVFTKELDDALLLGEIDIAVHSLKDVPTSPPKGIIQCAVLERANPYDVLVTNNKSTKEDGFKLASGSLRRRAFWKNRYPKHELKQLRGNVPTRLAKISDGETDGIILAKAGLDRLAISPENVTVLDWMIPAPAQGIVGVFCMDSNKRCKEILPLINHKNTEICAHVERDLLSALEGGCTAPIGAHAQIIKRSVEVKVSLLSIDGKTHVKQTLKKGTASYKSLGKEVANMVIENGGKAILKELKLGKKESVKEKSEVIKENNPELTPLSIKRTTPEISSKSDLPKVLCLKRLTPPRIKAGAKLGLQLSGIEVIETLPEFDSYEIKQWLTEKNNWVFSSLNAVSAITSVLKNTAAIHKHIFCVGSRVANYFDGKVKGIHQVNSVSDLTEEARLSGETDFVWFHGSKSDLELSEDFELLEMKLKPISVYRTELSEPSIENLEDYNVFAFFSPSGVESFNAHNFIPENAIVAAIGTTTAEFISETYDEQENTQLENIIVPEKFEYEHLLTAIQAHLKENGTN